MKQLVPQRVVYGGAKSTESDPYTGRFKKLVAEYTISDMHTDRECQKQTVNEDGRRVVLLGKRCSATFGVKIYKLNGASVNPLKRYVMFVGIARQNPIDIKEDEFLAEETAHENAIVDPIITAYLPCVLTEDQVCDFIQPILDVLPVKLVMTSKQARAKKEELAAQGYENWIRSKEDDHFWDVVNDLHLRNGGKKSLEVIHRESHL